MGLNLTNHSMHKTSNLSQYRKLTRMHLSSPELSQVISSCMPNSVQMKKLDFLGLNCYYQRHLPSVERDLLYLSEQEKVPITGGKHPHSTTSTLEL